MSPAPKRPAPGPPPEDPSVGPQASLPGFSPWSASAAGLVSGPAAAFSTTPPARAFDELPSIGHIGRYALKFRIGEGGLGTVYAAHDPVLSRLIAIKTVHAEMPPTERDAFNTLFLNEARAAARLSHPNIVTVFDAGLSEMGAYIAMELLKGRDLRQLRQAGWRPSPAEAALIVRQVADALAYAHALGVVHRDIKPANVFMVAQTQPRVLDFGIARVADLRDSSAAPDISAGSPYYMAPEQVIGLGVDRRCDVYSLGVVFYELLTGERCFRGASLAEIQQAVLEHRPPRADALAPAVPKALAMIAERAMSKAPQARHPSADALSRELKAWLEASEKPAVAAAPAPPRPATPRRAWMYGSALVVLAIAGGWAALSMRTPPDPTSGGSGLVTIEVSPSAEVEVDGTRVGTAPPLNQLALPEGRHTITLHNDGFAAYSVSVEVKGGQPVLVVHRFGP